MYIPHGVMILTQVTQDSKRKVAETKSMCYEEKNNDNNNTDILCLQ